MSEYTYRPNLISKGAKTIPYNPTYRKIAKNVVGCIVFQQLEYWFEKRKGEPFYKFLSPCPNKKALYKDGDSWTEELGISELEFRTAFDGIGIRYTSKTEYLSAVEKERQFYRDTPKGPEQVLLYCSYQDKKTGLTYYVRNHHYVDERIAELLAVDEVSSSTVDKGSEPIEMRKPHLPYIYQENTTEKTTTTGAVVVPSSERKKNNDPIKSVSPPVEMETVKEIITVTIGTPLEGMIPESIIPTLITDHNSQCHPDYPGETAPEAIKRLIRWTAAQMSDPKATPIPNPVGFLRRRAQNGMDKPGAIIRAEQAAEAERKEAGERRAERERLEKLKNEREIPPEARADLDRLLGRARAAV